MSSVIENSSATESAVSTDTDNIVEVRGINN